MRLSWEEYLMKMAYEIAQFSTCPSAKRGCVIVPYKDENILVTGYTDAPPGEETCNRFGCIMKNGCKRSNHAEVNAIAKAARFGIEINAGHAYIYAEDKRGKFKGMCNHCKELFSCVNVRWTLALPHHFMPQ